jgi:aspartyl-tRNA(Asn)/glutamyl-tRNA(Gln) amidotransferase subunit C
MKIARKEIEHVASLARLKVTDAEIQTFTEQLNSILNYFGKLQELDTSGVEPSFHAVQLVNVFRSDSVKDSLPAECSLRNAPEKERDCFKIPKVIE